MNPGALRGLQWLPVAALVVGWAHAGLKYSPADEGTIGPLVVAVIASVLVAFWCGRRSGHASAYATATAHAEARARARASAASTSQAAVFVNVGDGARHAAAAGYSGLDAAPWMGAPRPLLEQDTATQSIEDGGDVEVLQLEASEETPLSPIEGSAERT